ncbi:MAG: hypothetical protein M3Q48_05100, partial [Actinomycetota bacterium]|nr:hypothetical protein [Actinomycetota bacterium]
AEGPPADVLPLSSPARRRRRPPTWALSLAAAVLAVLVAVPLLLAGRDGPRGSDQLAGRAAPPRTEAAEADESPLAVGPDLGDQSDPSALRQVLANALATTPSGAALARPAPPPGGTTDAATEAAAPSRATNPSGSPAAGDDAEVISRCARSLRSSSGARLGPLVYAATLRWQDTPAVVLAYRVPGEENGRLAHQVFVMAREDCRVLVFQGL